ncbi:helicase-related protein [Halorubrum sp. LN27]|uniref:helicase-related protein n=1 Tax=Halorubrum sp. LN27 TaxID=2801032 RepID=UPI00190C6DB7|nr:helicase-related protein [Halorubrum sp. LN27]
MQIDRGSFLDQHPSKAGDAAYRDQERLGQWIAESVLEEASGTGSGPDGRNCYGDLPRDTYFAGSLIPSKEAELSGLSEDLQSKLSPTALQAEFLLKTESASQLTVSVSGNVYYRSFPTYEEQFEKSIAGTPSGDDDDSDPARQNGELTTVYRRLPFKTEPISIDLPGVGAFESKDAVSTNIQRQVLDTLQEELRKEIQAAETDASEPPVWRAAADVETPITVQNDAEDGEPFTVAVEADSYSGDYQFPPELFENVPEEEARARYEQLIGGIASQGPAFQPDWDINVQCEFFDDKDDHVRGVVTVENVSAPSPDTSGFDSRFAADDYDPTLFDVNIELSLSEGQFYDFTFERLDEDFRYDRNLAGYGTNCTVSRVDESTLRTNYVPTYRQQRYETRDPDDFDPEIDTSFQTLTDIEGGGLDALRNLEEQMRWYLNQEYPEYLADYEASGDFREEDRQDFEADKTAFKKEIQRVKRGIQALEWDLQEGDGHLVRSFELMNETFVSKVTNEDGEMEYDAWHLFQIAFILRVLPDIASREYDQWSETSWRDEGSQSENFDGSPLEALDVVDILWFPTGGGKTEAYLGLAVFNAFFDRKRGKRYGVTAWTRFPLRLLSLQQTQRIGEILMYAELHRLQEPDIRSAKNFPFTLGYLVGSKNTPNKVTNRSNKQGAKKSDYRREFERFRDPEGGEGARESVKVFPSCPVCGSDVKIRATDDLRLAHYCTANRSDCRYQQRNRSDSDYQIFADDELPVHIVDNELYRYAPTMIVGTIDKITAVGYERKSAHLYGGKMSHWCPDHGFASFGECTEKYGCDSRFGGENAERGGHLVPLSDTPFGESYDIAPGLQIQDELHLLEESLGTFDSHFETFVDKYQRYNGEQRTKIIGATATIEEYDQQAKELYLRKAERFPAQGPAVGENFYATTREATRRHFVGIMPHGKTHINAIIQLDYYYLRTIEQLRQELLSGSGKHELLNELEFETAASNDELLSILELYETALTYTISKRDKNRYTQSMRGQIAGYLREDGLREPNLAELTGDTPFEEVEDILGNLENPPEDYRQRFNNIAATNMISHGVDVNRFNHMLFFGMPRQTAEYIQSSSRAGRSFPGSVFVCFNPARERDQSHYHLFEKYHEFLDRLVEPVPINRWSHFSVRRTLPSMIFAWILNQWLYESGEWLYFGDQVSELIRSLQSGRGNQYGVSINNSEDFQGLLEASYGSDLRGELPEAFREILDRERDRAFTNLENIQQDMASEALSPGTMMSLRDIDDQIPFLPVDRDNENLFYTMNEQ